MRATVGLILAITALTLVGWSLEPEAAAGYLAYSSNNLLEGRVWTLFTALFIHGDVLHLAGNMLFLFAFGKAVEEELSASRFLGSFFFGGVVSFLLSSFFYPPGTLMVGASAAIFTLVAIAMLVRPLRFSWIFLSPIGLVAILYFLYNAFAVYKGIFSEVAYISHIIGFVVGFPIGISWSERWKRNLLITLLLLAVYVLVIHLIMRYLF